MHIESPVFRSFVLGDFFAVWGEPLSAKRAGPLKAANGKLRFFVGGSRYDGDPRRIEMDQHADIVIESGPPWVKPVKFTDWQGQ